LVFGITAVQNNLGSMILDKFFEPEKQYILVFQFSTPSSEDFGKWRG